MSTTHLGDRRIATLLERCPCLWERKIPHVGKISAYATKKGLVAFIDFARGRGWTMLTEHPSNSITANAKTLEMMIEGSEETVIITYARDEILETYADTKAMRVDAPLGTLDAIADMIENGAVSGRCPKHPDIKFRVMRVRR